MLQIGLIGYGTVGSGVYERLTTTKEAVQQLLGQEFEIKAILVKDRQKKRTENVETVVTTEWQEFCELAQYDVIFEAIGGIEPAFSYTTHWLEKGIPVITANKKLVAEKGAELEKAAEVNGTYYGYEAAVAGGVPIINALKGNLATTPISRVSGILNGTTNYMLTEMIENHRSFADVLFEAKELGYAEADPTDDLEGFDAWYKIRILSRLCFGEWPTVEAYLRQGISEIEDWHVEVGEKIGFKLKLIGEAWYDGEKVVGAVRPAFLSQNEPLANVRGVTNGISLEGSTINQLLFIGPGAGKEATANSMVEDYLFHQRTTILSSIALRKEKGEEPFSHALLFITHLEREQAIAWVKEHHVSVIDTYSHHEGEGWIITSSRGEDSPYPTYPIYGNVSNRKQVEAVHSAQFGSL
ncbi:homoserine dehydrogenase [Halalkalibacter nanhaiisediminis]|uniref:Homoserine dehydrogenase n=1 Tax=Halalkalibacter nanhaiisediminis TaxID=688079 RepID=A0A562QJC7_9BACI|nr:homoserine dehydrogenase [Halalkalibacter nanhaiisediminis]TWI56280.1 homoserine dehydrogenase [Halalkalibacter nanhaiisediminis]